MEEPKDLTNIKNILSAMVEDYTEETGYVLHEFFDRYVHEILAGAKLHADRRGDSVRQDDIKTSISARTQFAFQGPTPYEELAKLAENTNKLKLPSISDKGGVLLPSEEHCLLMKNWQVAREEDMELEL